MSPSLLLRVRIGPLIVISICIGLAAMALIAPRRQQAGAPTGVRSHNRLLPATQVTGKGGIAPEADTTTVGGLFQNSALNQSGGAAPVEQAPASGCSVPQFGGPTNFAVGNQPRSMASADFNHDGRNDLAVANYGTGQGNNNGSVWILLNNGSGFSTTNFTAGINPRSIVSADFNNDTNPDIAVLNYVNGSCCITTVASVFLGDGTGNFSLAGTPITVGNDASSITAGDFNKDGKQDLAATVSQPFGTIAVLLGNGAGGFNPVTNYSAAGSATAIVTGDLNGDNKPDLVTSNLNGFNISVLLGDGAGAFGSATTFTVGGGNPQFIALGDLNHDFRLDVVTANTGNNVSVLLGNGNGTFAAANTFTTSSSPRSVVIADFNGDSFPDLATSNGSTSNASVLLGNGSGGFGSPSNYIAGASPFFILSNDFNGDLKPDLVIGNIGSNDISILAGDGLGGFGGGRSFNVGLTPMSVAGADFNGDGKPDLAVANAGQNSVSILLGDGSGNFGADTKFPTGFVPRDVVAGDFNGDDKLDLAVALNNCCGITQGVSILLGNGNGSFAAPVSYNAGTGTWSIVSADFNHDGKADLAVVNNADSNLSILIGNGNGTFAAPVNFNLPGSPTDLAVGDFNGDGDADIAAVAGNVTILFGNGAGGFAIGSPIMVGGVYVAVGDLNGDGKADLGVVNLTDTLSVLLGDGTGNFGAANSFSVSSPRGLNFADFNGDGSLDVVVGTSTSRLTVLLGDGTGNVGTPTLFSAGNAPTGILALDLNADRRPDLVSPDSNTVTVLTNACQAPAAVPPSLSINDVVLTEGNNGTANASFTVSLSSASDKTVTVDYYSGPATALSGVDYQPVSGQLTFSPGTTSRTINVPVIGDTSFEGNEVFNLFLANNLNGDIVKAKGTGTILDDDTGLSLSSGNYSVDEGANIVNITVQRFGNTTGTSTVDFATSDNSGTNNCNVVTGAASSRCDYLIGRGNLSFAANETSKAISIPIVDDAYAEGPETFTLTLSNPGGATLVTPAAATITITDNDSANGLNPIDAPRFFVRQHYLDFLNRQPDQNGWDFWTNQITNCGSDVGCTEVHRINVSASFFLSIEFQQTGYLVERMYKVAYGDATGTSTFNGSHQLSVPNVRFNEFLAGTQRIGQGVIVLQPGWESLLESNKQAYALEFVQTTRFITALPTTMTPAQFVDRLNENSGGPLSLSERQAAVDVFGGAGNTTNMTARAQAVRMVAEDQTLYDAEYNKAFVLAEYFGYLRRDPNAAPESMLDYTGYDFWLTKLNQFNGNYINAEMVKAFLSSIEYRQRFGP